MLVQYRILNMCLSQLDRSGLSTVSKLKLEVQLYHLKRLLLMDEVAAIVKDNASSENEFMDLYEGFKKLVADDATTTDIEGLLVRQNELNEDICALYRADSREPSLEMLCFKNATSPPPRRRAQAVVKMARAFRTGTITADRSITGNMLGTSGVRP